MYRIPNLICLPLDVPISLLIFLCLPICPPSGHTNTHTNSYSEDFSYKVRDTPIPTAIIPGGWMTEVLDEGCGKISAKPKVSLEVVREGYRRIYILPRV